MLVRPYKVKSSQPVWWDEDCNEYKQEKYIALRKYRISDTTQDFQEYKFKCNLFKTICRSKKMNYQRLQRQRLINARTNPKLSWSLLKQSRQTSRTHNAISADDWVIHFTSLLYHENASSLNFHIPPTIADDDFDLDLPFTIEEIQNAINNLASNKSPGPDGIPSEFLKYTSYEIQPFCCQFLTLSLNRVYFQVIGGRVL